MTAKELEHFLIDNDFTFHKWSGETGFMKDAGYWQHKHSSVAISDASVQDDPQSAKKFIEENLKEVQQMKLMGWRP